MKYFLSIFLAGIIIFSAESAFARENHSWFWFIYEKGSDDLSSFRTIRPFYLKNTYNDGSTYTAFLPPVIASNYKNNLGYKNHYFFSLSGETYYNHSGKKEDYDLVLPPVFYGSGSESKDRYLMVWPIGGTLKQKLGYDYITPVIFPGVALFFLYPPSSTLMIAAYCLASLIPLYTEYGYKDYHAKAVLWPFFMKGEGGGRKSIRIFPFYAHHTKKGFYDRKSYFLIYNYGETYTSKRTYKTFFLFPFYGKKWTDDGMVKSTTILWPFFSWGYNKIRGEESLNMPWPFFQKAKSKNPDMEKLIIFPFYGRYRYGTKKTVFYTPFYFRQTKENGYFHSDYKVISFIIWKFHREYRFTEHPYYGKKWDYFKIWPLFHYESNDRGDRDFSLLSIFFFRDPDGYERLYLPVVSLLEYHKRKDISSFGLLFRTYYQYRKGNYFQWAVPLIANYSSYNGRTTNFSFLFSSFGYFHDERGQGFKLFWIPIITDSSDKIVFDNPLESEKIYMPVTYRFKDTVSNNFSFGTAF